MEKSTLQQLINQTGEALVQAGASSYYQKVFKTLTRQLLLYSHEQGTDSFSMDFGLQFLEDHYSMSSKIEQKKWCTAYSRCINALVEYQRSGNVTLYLAMDKRAYTFPEGFRHSAEAYISYREDIGIIKKSNKIFSLYLERFFAFLSRKNIASLDTLSLKDVLDFMASLNCYEKPTINHTMRAARYYLKYCHEHGLMEQEMFSKLPNPHYNRQSRLPSSYSADEVAKLLDSIDLGNPCGIRDYAIILLIARLGLRSRDVANLRFSNIDWEREAIHLTQVKTGNPLELPLLEDVGEALINYLKNARPKTDSDHVFVRQVPPYTDFNPGAVGALVRVRLQRSGIHLEGKKKGSHTLRHSLASRLLEHEIPLPVISEILGHTTTETTMAYLRIDITELRKCALEVAI
jgi:integrase